MQYTDQYIQEYRFQNTKYKFYYIIDSILGLKINLK